MLNDQEGCPIENVSAKHSGLRAKDAPAEQAGGLARKTYICMGGRCIAPKPAMQDRGIYNGAIGNVVGLAFRESEIPPSSLPDCVLVRFPKYCGPVFLENGPNSVPIAPIERLLHCRCRCARAMRPIDPSLGITLRKIHGMTCGTGSDAERVVVHPATPSFGKSHPGGLYAA